MTTIDLIKSRASPLARVSTANPNAATAISSPISQLDPDSSSPANNCDHAILFKKQLVQRHIVRSKSSVSAFSSFNTASSSATTATTCNTRIQKDKPPSPERYTQPNTCLYAQDLSHRVRTPAVRAHASCGPHSRHPRRPAIGEKLPFAHTTQPATNEAVLSGLSKPAFHPDSDINDLTCRTNDLKVNTQSDVSTSSSSSATTQELHITAPSRSRPPTQIPVSPTNQSSGLPNPKRPSTALENALPSLSKAKFATQSYQPAQVSLLSRPVEEEEFEPPASPSTSMFYNRNMDSSHDLYSHPSLVDLTASDELRLPLRHQASEPQQLSLRSLGSMSSLPTLSRSRRPARIPSRIKCLDYADRSVSQSVLFGESSATGLKTHEAITEPTTPTGYRAGLAPDPRALPKQLYDLKTPLFVPAVLRKTESLVDIESSYSPASDTSSSPSKPVSTQTDRRHWVPDALRDSCLACKKPFTIFDRRHHCRKCGEIYCSQDLRNVVRLNKDCRFSPLGMPAKSCEACHSDYEKFKQSMALSVDDPRQEVMPFPDLARDCSMKLDKVSMRKNDKQTFDASRSSLVVNRIPHSCETPTLTPDSSKDLFAACPQVSTSHDTPSSSLSSSQDCVYMTAEPLSKTVSGHTDALAPPTTSPELAVGSVLINWNWSTF